MDKNYTNLVNNKPNPNVAQMLDAIRKYGPMTAEQMVQKTGIDPTLGNPNFSGVTTDNSYASGTATVKPPAIEVTNQTPAPLNAPTFNPSKPIPSSVLSSGFTIQDVLGERKRLADELAKNQIASQREQELAQRIKDIETGSTTAQLGLEGQGRGITQDILSKQGAAIQRRETIAKLPLVNELNTLVSQRSSQIDAVKSQLDLTSQNLNILTELQKMTQPDIVGNPIVDKVTGTISALIKDPQTGQIVQQTIGSVGVEDAQKSFVQTGTYTNAQNERVFYGVTPDGRIEQQVLGGEQMPASVIAAQTKAQQVATPAAEAGIPSKYQDVANIILGSTNFTQNDKKSFINALNSGANPWPVISNRAKKLLGTEGTTLTKLESAFSAMEELDSLTKQFYANGGKSGVLKGNFEKAQNRLGQVNDPNLVNIAVQIAASLQKYRNAVSGTAYSEQEGRDIAAIFPGIDKGEVLNNTIIKARLSNMSSDIDALYRGALGEAYDSVKPTSGNQNKPPLNSFIGGTTQGTAAKPPLSSFFK